VFTICLVQCLGWVFETRRKGTTRTKLTCVQIINTTMINKTLLLQGNTFTCPLICLGIRHPRKKARKTQSSSVDRETLPCWSEHACQPEPTNIVKCFYPPQARQYQVTVGNGLGLFLESYEANLVHTTHSVH